nr:hypothetical protein [Tanacetum cinerariifolium]
MQSMEETLSKSMSESTKRHEENSITIKEIQALTDASVQNQGASFKTLEIQIGQISKVLQERGFGSLPTSIKSNPRDHVKSISTTAEADSNLIRCIGSSQYVVSTPQNKRLMFESREMTILFPSCLNDYYCKEKNGSSLDSLYGDYIELNNLNVPLELRRDQVDDLMPTIEEVKNMDGYRDQDMGDIILRESFCKASCVEARRFNGLITIHNSSDNVTYQMAQSHPRFKHLSNAQCNKTKPLLKYMTRSSTKELFTPFKEPEQEFQSSRKLLKTLSLEESRSPGFNLFSVLEEYFKEEVAKTMTETMEQYMSKTRADYGSGIARLKIDEKYSFELKGQFLKELRDNTFHGSDHKDANEHIEKNFEIADLFHIHNITQDQVMLRAFPMSLIRAASRWLRNNHMVQSQLGKILRQTVQAQLNNLGREIKKVNEKVYVAQVGCEQCKGPTTPKISHSKKKVKPLKKLTTLNLVDLSNEGDIKQQLWDSTRGTMQTLCTKNECNLWKKP